MFNGVWDGGAFQSVGGGAPGGPHLMKSTTNNELKIPVKSGEITKYTPKMTLILQNVPAKINPS